MTSRADPPPVRVEASAASAPGGAGRTPWRPSAPHGAPAMVVATLLWGATFVVIRDSLGALAPTSLVFLRFGIAAILFAGISGLRRTPFDRATVVGGVVTGLLTAGGYLFQAIGLTATSAGSSAFITSAGTLMAGFFAWALLRQRPSPLLAGGLIVAGFGCSLMGRGADLRLGPGEWWTLLGALAYGLQVVLAARFAPRSDPIALAGIQALVVAVLLSPCSVRAFEQARALAPDGWLRLGYLAIAGSLIAPTLQMVAQRTLPPGRIGLLFALEPVFALGFAVTVGGERFGARWWWGAALILASVTIVEAYAARKPASTPSPSV